MKLADEEISRALSQAAVGKLNHSIFGSRDDSYSLRGCGCIAGSAYALGAVSINLPKREEYERAYRISDAVMPIAVEHGNDYGGSPDRVLRNLAHVGLVKGSRG